MPNHDQQMLLLDNCSSEWTEVNGIYGSKFTAPNGGTIFLPAAGARWNDDTGDVGRFGYYWSSTQNPYNSYYLDFGSGSLDGNDSSRYNGHSVRSVTE